MATKKMYWKDTGPTGSLIYWPPGSVTSALRILESEKIFTDPRHQSIVEGQWNRATVTIRATHSRAQCTKIKENSDTLQRNTRQIRVHFRSVHIALKSPEESRQKIKTQDMFLMARNRCVAEAEPALWSGWYILESLETDDWKPRYSNQSTFT